MRTNQDRTSSSISAHYLQTKYRLCDKNPEKIIRHCQTMITTSGCELLPRQIVPFVYKCYQTTVRMGLA